MEAKRSRTVQGPLVPDNGSVKFKPTLVTSEDFCQATIVKPG